MAKITNQLIVDVTELYNETNQATGSAGALIRLLLKHEGGDIVDIAEDFGDIRTQKGRESLNDILASLAKHFRELKRSAVSKDFSVLSERMKGIIADGEPSFEDLRYPTQEEWEEFHSTLTGVARALSSLFWYGGFKAEDLAKDKHKLSKTIDGIVEIESGMGTTRGRTVISDNSFGLTQEDYEELLPLLQDKLFSSQSLGLQVLSIIGKYTNGWRFSPTQIRVGHAEQLLNDGLSIAEVADIQGVRPETLRLRQRKYRNARKG